MARLESAGPVPNARKQPRVGATKYATHRSSSSLQGFSRSGADNGRIDLPITYDHRIIDGREVVLSLVTIKEALEDPARLLLNL